MKPEQLQIRLCLASFLIGYVLGFSDWLLGRACSFLSCSSNMVAEGIGRQAPGAVARRRRATLLSSIFLSLQMAALMSFFAKLKTISNGISLSLNQTKSVIEHVLIE